MHIHTARQSTALFFWLTNFFFFVCVLRGILCNNYIVPRLEFKLFFERSNCFTEAQHTAVYVFQSLINICSWTTTPMTFTCNSNTCIKTFQLSKCVLQHIVYATSNELRAYFCKNDSWHWNHGLKKYEERRFYLNCSSINNMFVCVKHNKTSDCRHILAK